MRPHIRSTYIPAFLLDFSRPGASRLLECRLLLGPAPAGRCPPHLKGPGRVPTFPPSALKTQQMLSSSFRKRISQPYMWAVITAGAAAGVYTLTQLRPSELGLRFLLIGLVTLAFGSRVSVPIP